MHLEGREYGIVPEDLVPEVLVGVCSSRLPEAFFGCVVDLCPYLVEQAHLDFRGWVELLAVDIQQGAAQHVVGELESGRNVAVLDTVQVVDYQSKSAPESSGARPKNCAAHLEWIGAFFAVIRIFVFLAALLFCEEA